jgi:RNA polymerase sigma-70 factor (ECF subfamily)
MMPIPGACENRSERWVDEHGDCLFRYALTRVRNETIAEDLVQETLLAAVRGRERYAGCAGERSWLVGILKHKICDYFRKAGRETTFTDLCFRGGDEDEEFDAEGYWIEEQGPGGWKPEGEAAVERAEFWKALEACLERLPERIAKVFIMREVDEVPGKVICEALHITEANLWTMLHRARRALRQGLEETYFRL